MERQIEGICPQKSIKASGDIPIGKCAGIKDFFVQVVQNCKWPEQKYGRQSFPELFQT